MDVNYWKIPLLLIQNKIPRYPGGREIDKFRGEENPKDDNKPEAWVGSTTYVRGLEDENSSLGLAEAVLPTGDVCFLKDLVEERPLEMLGKSHYEKFGDEASILVKLLDAENQLGLQTHPTRDYAKKHFNSDFGKVESWYIIGLREDQEEEPYVLLGFKEGITREIFEELYNKDDIKSMEEWCHKIPVNVGDVFIVDAGVPHAIGPGCFMVEVQEASDITVGARRRSFGDKEKEKEYDERLLGCYIYEGLSYEENLNRYLIDSKPLREDENGNEKLLLGKDETTYFSITEIEVLDEYVLKDLENFSVAIVLEGEGQLIYDEGTLSIHKSTELFLPAGIDNLTIKSTGDKPLKIVRSHPPEIY